MRTPLTSIVVACVLGTSMAQADVASRNVTLVSNIRLESNNCDPAPPVAPPAIYADVWGYRTTMGPSYREYALVTLRSDPDGPGPLAGGLWVVDVTNPGAPFTEGVFVFGGTSTGGLKDVETWGRYAYVTRDGNGNPGEDGMLIVDLEGTPANGYRPFVAGHYSSSFRAAHNLHIADGYLYAMLPKKDGALQGGMQILDLDNPLQPGARLTYSFAPYGIHDGATRGNRFYGSACGSSCGSPMNRKQSILDISALFTVPPPNTSTPITIPELGAASTPLNFAHSNAVSMLGTHLLTADESSADGHLRVLDVQDPTNIRQVGEYFPAPNRQIHQVEVVGNTAFLAYYENGYRIVDITNLESPVEIGFFDHISSDNSTPSSLRSAFGVYPFAGTGMVYVIEKCLGLMVYSYTPTDGAVQGVLIESLDPIPGVRVAMTGGPSTTSNAQGFYKLYGDPGPRTLTFSKPGFQTVVQTANIAQGGTALASISMQRVTNSPLTGTVRTATGSPVANAQVSLFTAELATTTDALGQYSFAHVPIGSQWVRVEHPGHAPQTRGVTIPVGSGAVLDFTMGGTIYSTTFATATDWQVGLPSDNATSGAWEWCLPVAAGLGISQPGADHTPGSDVHCLVTGNATATSLPVDAADVDGGVTTAMSPVIDLTTHPTVHVSFWRWYFNGERPELFSTDALAFEASNNGGSSWVPIENLASPCRGWTLADVRVSDYLPLTSQMRFRILARDQAPETEAVEALVDDFSLYDQQTGSGIVVDASMAAWATEGSDPSNMMLVFSFAASGAPSSIEVRYKRQGTSTWISAGCAAPGPGCTIAPNGLCTISAFYSPCEGTNFQWQARVKGCGPWSSWSAVKTFAAYCLTPSKTAQSPAPVRFDVVGRAVEGGRASFRAETPSPGRLVLRVYDVAGRQLATAFDRDIEAGTQEIQWNARAAGGRRLAAGLYFFSATMGREVIRGRVLMLP
jgi:hypothetical protein